MKPRKKYSWRNRVGVLLREWPSFEWHLRTAPHAIRNFREKLEFAPGGGAARCCWRWTTDLHACKVFPVLGRRLMGRMLEAWPIFFADAPRAGAGEGTLPAVSFVIGHRGPGRREHLLATVATIAAQEGVSFECIVVEQSVKPELAGQLPVWVRYCHTPLPQDDLPFSRAWAFNVGARLAQGELLVLHDNDLLIPRGYAAQAWQRFREGYQVVNLKRFIFYLTEEATVRLTREPGSALAPADTSAVMQNAQGGGSLAVGRETCLELGGFDESFLGWGGEDNEFWERCQSRSLWPFGYLPLVHLWHPPQAGKEDQSWGNRELMGKRSLLDVSLRIRELASRSFGNPRQLDPPPVLPTSTGGCS
jgi:GT2 family glycosyltransferase